MRPAPWLLFFTTSINQLSKVLKLKSEPCHTRAQDRPNQRSQPSHIPCSIPSAFPLESSLATQCPSTSLQDASEQVWNGLNSLWVRWESQSCGREGWHWTWLSSDYDLFRLQPFCQKKCWNLQHRLKPSQASPVEGLPAGDDFFHSLDTEGDQPWFHLKDLESGRPHQSHALPHWSHCILEVVFIRSCESMGEPKMSCQYRYGSENGLKNFPCDLQLSASTKSPQIRFFPAVRNLQVVRIGLICWYQIQNKSRASLETLEIEHRNFMDFQSLQNSINFCCGAC